MYKLCRRHKVFLISPLSPPPASSFSLPIHFLDFSDFLTFELVE